MTKPITEHEGKKYLRVIHDAKDSSKTVEIDVYSVLEAFNVTCPGRQQAVKKLLCAGLRGKGAQLEDLLGADAALSRAIDLQRGRDKSSPENLASIVRNALSQDKAGETKETKEDAKDKQ